MCNEAGKTLHERIKTSREKIPAEEGKELLLLVQTVLGLLY